MDSTGLYWLRQLFEEPSAKNWAAIETLMSNNTRKSLNELPTNDIKLSETQWYWMGCHFIHRIYWRKSFRHRKTEVVHHSSILKRCFGIQVTTSKKIVCAMGAHGRVVPAQHHTLATNRWRGVSHQSLSEQVLFYHEQFWMQSVPHKNTASLIVTTHFVAHSCFAQSRLCRSVAEPASCQGSWVVATKSLQNW